MAGSTETEQFHRATATRVAEPQTCGRLRTRRAPAIAEHFRPYNEEFGRITRRAALNFLAEDWHAAQLDAVARIELYEQRVARCVAGGRRPTCRPLLGDAALWTDIKRAYEMLVARRPDSDFYRTFFNSVTRDLFGTVGVNPEVEFCATTRGPRLGRGADPRIPRRRLDADGGARSARRSALRRRDRRIRTRRCTGSARRSADTSPPGG